jgi:ribosomal protein S24E
MKIDVVEEKKNDLFSRNEVKVKVEEEIIPSNKEAREIVAKKFSCDEDLVRINKVEGKFGTHLFYIYADIYDSKDEFLRVVKKTKQEIDAEKKAEEERLKAEAEAKEAEKVAKEEADKPAEESNEETGEGKIKGDKE